MSGKLIAGTVAALAVLFGAAQFVQPQRANPVVDPSATFAAVGKPVPAVAALVDRSCRDCHSDQTVWPWYSRVSPVSWMVAGDVKRGREKLNFSHWNIYGPEMSQIRLRDACEQVKAGHMPLSHYLLMHSDARPTDEDKQALCAAAQ